MADLNLADPGERRQAITHAPRYQPNGRRIQAAGLMVHAAAEHFDRDAAARQVCHYAEAAVGVPSGRSAPACAELDAMSGPARRTPSIIAIERLAKLAAAGSSVDRLVAAERGIVDGRAEHIAYADLKDRIVTLTNDVELGILPAQDYVAEAEGDVQRAAAI